MRAPRGAAPALLPPAPPEPVARLLDGRFSPRPWSVHDPVNVLRFMVSRLTLSRGKSSNILSLARSFNQWATDQTKPTMTYSAFLTALEAVVASAPTAALSIVHGSSSLLIGAVPRVIEPVEGATQPLPTKHDFNWMVQNAMNRVIAFNRLELDPLVIGLKFIEMFTVTGPGRTVSATDMLAAYDVWAAVVGVPPSLGPSVLHTATLFAATYARGEARYRVRSLVGLRHIGLA